MKAQTTTQKFVSCPSCGGGEKRICHLFTMPMPCTWGAWHCEECGKWFSGRVNSPDDIDIWVDESRQPLKNCVDILVLPPQEKPIYFAMKSYDYNDMESKGFFYESHSCPTNWLPSVEMMYFDGSPDPHGVIEYAGSEIVPADFYDEPNQCEAETLNIMARQVMEWEKKQKDYIPQKVN